MEFNPPLTTGTMNKIPQLLFQDYPYSVG